MTRKHPPDKIVIFVVTPLVIVIVVLMIVLSMSLGHTTTSAIEDKTATDSQNQVLQNKADQGQTLADQIQKACLAGGALSKQLQDQFGACVQAQMVQAAPTTPIPGPAGVQGERGLPGRGITATAIVASHLMVSYSDGAVEDKGVVVGQNGTKGADGRGIQSTAIGNGHLMLTYTDGQVVDIGQVVGKDGTDGQNGQPGRGIQSTAINASYHLIVTYTDGTSTDIGQLPPGPAGPTGPQGPAGRSLIRQYFDRNSNGECHNYNEYSDGTTADQGPAGDSACPVSPPSTSASMTPSSTP